MIRNIICCCISFLQPYCENVNEETSWQQWNAYMAGVLSVSFVWLLKSFWQALQLVPDNLHNNNNNTNRNNKKKKNSDNNNTEEEEEDHDDDNLSWIDPWNVPIQATNRIMASLNNIGELPRTLRRRHWPWETIRRRFSSHPIHINAKEEHKHTEEEENPLIHDPASLLHKMEVTTTDSIRNSSMVATDLDGDDEITLGSAIEENDTFDTEDPPLKHNGGGAKKQKSLCIGSIFGLDVGGTLAKLVYFEQKQLCDDPIHESLRHRHYTKAASAQAVIMARMDNAMKHDRRKFLRSIRSSSCDFYAMKANTTKSCASPKQSQYSNRRRSLVIGSLGRSRKVEEEEKRAEDDILDAVEDKERKSDEDLKQMQLIRQESLPDDTQKFRRSVDFHCLEDEYHKEHATQNGEKVEKSLPSASALMGRSRSMFDLSSVVQQKAEALENFYNFARRLGDEEHAIRDHKLSFYSRDLGGEFHFLRFETRRMGNAMDLIRYNNLHLNIQDLGATGGGAHKFAEDFENQLGIRMDKQDELDSLVAGMQFVLSTVVGECYSFRPRRNAPDRKSRKSHSNQSVDDNAPHSSQVRSTSDTSADKKHNESDNVTTSDGLQLDETIESETELDQSSGINNDLPVVSDPETKEIKVDEWWWSRKVPRDSVSDPTSYPYLLVTIGTGVSVLRVDGPRQYERISGSTIGGGTYWGLMRLLTDVETFDDAMELAEVGDPSKVDMMVGDIYGTNSDALEKLGLPANVVASSFGKLVAKEDPAEGLTQEDLARALLLLVTNNIGQVAHLNAKLSNTRRIYFVGSFLRENNISQQRLAYAINFWSKGEMEALFLEHEGYFGALGAFLKSQKIEKRNNGFFQWQVSQHGQSH